MSQAAKKFVLLIGLVLCLAPDAEARGGVRTADALVGRLECPDRVKDVAFSPDGKLLAAGYGWDEGGVRIWSLAERKTVADLSVAEKGANVSRVAFSPDGKLFAAGNWDGDVVVWAVGSWGSPKTVLKKRGSTESLAFSPNGAKLAFASEEEAVLYDLGTRREVTLGKAQSPQDALVGLSLSADGGQAIVFRRRAVEVRDAESGKLVTSWEPGGMGFFGGVSPDGRHVVAGGGAVYGKKVVEIRDAKDGGKVGELSDFRSGLFALAFSNSGKLIALSGGDWGGGGDVSLWNLEERREVGFISYGRFPIQGLAFSPDDSILAAASDDDLVLLYAVERIRGPQVKKQEDALCGEVAVEGGSAFIVPVSKVPRPMSRDFEFPWRLEVANADSLAGAAGSPVMLEDWDIESTSATDRARVRKFRPLLSTGPPAGGNSVHVVFGDVQNPGWDESYLAKIYGDGSFLVTNNSGKCLSNGNLKELKTDLESLKKRLTGAGLLSIAKEPQTIGASHYRTRFIELSDGGVTELRTDAASPEVLLGGGVSKKREDFSRVFKQEESFINSLLRAGLKTAPGR